MSVLHKIFIKDFKLLKFGFFLLTSFFLYGELLLFFVERPTLTSDAKKALAPINFPEILICKIDGYDKGRVNHFFLGKSSDSEFLRPPSPFLESSEFFKGCHMVKGSNKYQKGPQKRRLISSYELCPDFFRQNIIDPFPNEQLEFHGYDTSFEYAIDEFQ